MQCTSLVRSAKNVGTGETNHYSELCNTKNKNGEDVFRTIRVGLVCDACREAGLAASCTHRAADVPNWKSDEGREDVNALYGDRTTLLLRESLGVVCDDANTVFPVAHVNAWYARPPVALEGSRIENIFIAYVENNFVLVEMLRNNNSCAIKV